MDGIDEIRARAKRDKQISPRDMKAQEIARSTVDRKRLLAEYDRLCATIAARDAQIAELRRERADGCLDCKYKAHSQHISRQHHCNTCAAQKTCGICPGLGEWGRINCAQWRGTEG